MADYTRKSGKPKVRAERPGVGAASEGRRQRRGARRCLTSPPPIPRRHAAPRRPTLRESEALAYLTAATTLVTAEDLGRDLAYCGEPRGAQACRSRGNAILLPLATLGLVTMPKSSRFAITERGRIATALVMAKHPGLREAFFDE